MTDIAPPVASALLSEQLRIGEQKYHSLVLALRDDDRQMTFNLRPFWKDILAYVREKQPPLPPELSQDRGKQAALILWISTPPDPTPLGWDQKEAPLPPYVREERNRRIALANQLWVAWANPARLLDELQSTLQESGYARASEWLVRARHCFHDTPPLEFLDEEVARDEQFRLDVFAGFGALVDQEILRQPGPRGEVGVEVCGADQPLVLRLPDGESISLADLGGALASGLPDDFAREKHRVQAADRLALAIALALPAHADVVPHVTAETGPAHCRLWSTREPLIR